MMATRITRQQQKHITRTTSLNIQYNVWVQNVKKKTDWKKIDWILNEGVDLGICGLGAQTEHAWQNKFEKFKVWIITEVISLK